MAQELAGKVAIVTGGASGIGRGTVELFLEEGAKVVIADVDRRGGKLAAEIGSRARFKRTDVSNPDEVQALVDFAVSEFGALHVMFNNAGISTVFYSRFLDDELTDFQRVMAVNVLGVMLGSQRAGRHMAKHGGGSIINTASTAAEVAGYGVMTYRASKAAVVQFSKSLAIDLGEYGIRVNCIAPGNIPTGMTSYTEPGVAPEIAERVRVAAGAVLMSAQALKRSNAPRDVAQAALFLGSDRSKQITGMVLPVDAGMMAGDTFNYIDAIAAARTKVMES